MEFKEVQAVFVDRLIGLLQEKGLSRSAFAVAVKIPRTTINNWLNNKRSPQVDSLYKIAKFFGVSADYLLGLED